MEQAGVQLIVQGGDVYITTLDKATNVTNTFVGATESGSGRVSGAGEIMVGALRKVGEFAVESLTKAAQATAEFVGDSVKLAGNFEQGMLGFQAVAGKDVDTKGLEQFRDLFLQLGKELPVSTSDVQQAAIEMVKGGIDPAIVAAGGLKQNIQFAAAAMDGDLVAAAEVSSKILGGWADANATAQQKTDFLTHSTDLLTKAANASSVDVHELSLGIFNAQGTAKTAGVSFDDLTTTLAALSPRFASSSEAGNSLKNVIARLQPTTKPAIAAMEGLGLITEDGKNKFYDAQGSFIGFEKASQLLQDSLKGLTDQQKQAVLQTIFGNDAMNAASGLAELGASGYQHMAEALDKANGVQENAALKQQGFNTALDNAKGSVEALQITIGSALLPVLTDLLNNVVAPAVNTLTDMADAIFGNDDAFARLSPTAQAVVHVIDVLIADVQEIVGAFNEAGAGSSEFGESIGLLASDLGLPGDLIEDIVFGIQDLVKWFGQAGDAGDSLGGVIDDLTGIWQKALKTVQDVGNGYLAIAQSILPIVAQFWDDHGAEITAFLQTAYTKIMAIVNTALDLYDAIVPKVLHSVAGWIGEHATGIQAVLSGAWQAISGIVDGALTLIEGILKTALDLIHGDWSKAWEDIKTMSVQVTLDLEQAIEGFLNIIAGFFNTNLQEIGDLWSHNWDAIVDYVSNIDWMDVGASVIAGIIQGLTGNEGRLFDTLKNLAKDALQAAKDALGISSPSTAFMPIGQFAVEGIIAGLTDAWPSLTDQIGTLADGLVDKMRDIGSQMQDAIASGFGATASIDRQIAKNLDSVKNVLPEYTDFVTGALKEAQDQAQSFLDPAEGAKYFKLKSDQIFEYAALQKKLSEAQSEDDKARIRQQMLLINRAQTAELSQFDAQQQAASPLLDMADQVNRVLEAISHLSLSDDQIHIVDQLASIWSALQAPMLTRQQAYANPPMQGGQYGAANGSTNYTTNSWTMPVYTNQTPDALAASWQVLYASMP